MPKTQEINRFEWCDIALPIFKNALHEDDVLIFDHKTGIAYTGHMMGGSGDLTKELAWRLSASEYDTLRDVPLYLEEV